MVAIRMGSDFLGERCCSLKLSSMENFGKFCFGFLAVLLTSIYGGFVFSKLWLWIIVQHFNLNHLNIYQSIGVVFFIGAFIRTTQKEEEDKTKTAWERFILLVLKSVFLYTGYLAIGYVYYVIR